MPGLHRGRAVHLFGPLLIRSPNPRFLHGPFLVGDMDWPLTGLGYGDMDSPLSGWGYGLGVIGHASSICLDSCGIGVWLGTCGMAALMRCTSPCVFCCISCNVVFGGRSVTHLMDHGTWSRLTFGLTKAARLPRKMRGRMRQMCVHCVVRTAPPSQLVVSARSIIVMNVMRGTSCLLANA